MDRSFTYHDLLRSEAATLQATRAALPGVAEAVPRWITALLRLAHLQGSPPPPETVELAFHGFSWQRYVLAPYSFRAIFLLCELGHYDQAILAIRHVLEVFIQLRYFDRHKEQLEGHWMGANKKARVLFRTMFDEFAPGYYERYYRKQLSGISHGLLAAGPFRFVPQGGNRLGAIEGAVYLEDGANYVLNSTLPILYGYFHHAPHFFPDYPNVADQETEELRRWSIDVLDQTMKSHAEKYPQSKEWHDLLDLIVR